LSWWLVLLHVSPRVNMKVTSHFNYFT
jgi:hypothetical protein